MATKYDPPSGAPPAYGSQMHQDAGPATPQPAHTQQTNPPNEYYGAGASPYAQNGSPYPNQAYPDQQPSPFPGPGRQPYGGYPPQQGYGPPQGYYQQGPGPYQQGPGPYQQGPYYAPQGQYYDNNRGGSGGFMEAMLAGLACCCCLDACLLF